MLERTVESRFHDYFIYQDSTLEVAVAELKLLFDKGFFKYCTVQSILQFTLNWTRRAGNEECYTLANDILNSIDPIDNQEVKDEYSNKLMVNVKETYYRISRRYDLWCGKPGKEFSMTFKCFSKLLKNQKLRKQTSNHTTSGQIKVQRRKRPPQKPPTVKKSTIQPEQKKQSHFQAYLEYVENEKKKKKAPKPVLEDVLVTISPTRYMIEDFRGKGRDRDPNGFTLIFNGEKPEVDEKKDDLHKFPGPMLDVSVYVPKKRQWFHLNSQFQEWPLDAILTTVCWIHWDYVSANGDKFLVGIADDDYDHNESQRWYSMDLNGDSAYGIRSDRMSSRTFDTCETRIVQCADGTMYSILKTRWKFDKICHPVHYEDVELRCYKVIENETTRAEVINSHFATVFSIPSFSTKVSCAKHYVKMSKKSKEMIIVYYCSVVGIMRCFIADMKEDEPVPLEIYSINDDEYSKIEGCDGQEKAKLEILEGSNAFYIVEVSAKNTKAVSKVTCIYEYAYKSNVLTPSTKPGVEVTDMFHGLKRHEESDELEMIKGIPYRQMFYEHSKSDKGSLWNFSGSEYNGSTLSEVKVDAKGNLSVENHRPPPFACVTGMFPAKVTPAVLAKGRPIVYYLTSKKLP